MSAVRKTKSNNGPQAVKSENVNQHLLRFMQQAIEPALPETDAYQYAVSFTSKCIDIRTLCYLDRGDLRELGVNDVSHCARILHAAERAKMGQWREDSPLKASGKPVIVFVKFGCAALSAVDSVNGTAKIKYFFDMYWHDKNLIGTEPGPLSDFAWRPDAMILNSDGEMSKECLNDPPILVDSSTGKVLSAILFSGFLSDTSEGLKDFPYDENRLQVKMMQTESFSSADFVFRPHDPHPQSFSIFFDHTTGLSDWDLRGITLTGFEEVGGNGVNYAVYTVDFHLKRKRLYYLYKVTFPIVLSTAFCFSSFFFESYNLADRNNTACTMFLATSALLLVLASSLPKTDFLTMIDKFTIWSIVVQFAMAVLAWTCSKLHTGGDTEAADTLDGIAASILPAAYAIVSAILFGPYEWEMFRLTPQTPPRYLGKEEAFFPIHTVGPKEETPRQSVAIEPLGKPLLKSATE